MTVSDYAALASALFSFVSTLTSGVFIYYTIKTFREMKRQTDLQSHAFLVVAAGVSDEPTGVHLVPSDLERLHGKWKGILSAHVPAAAQPDKYLWLKLQNRGKSDIIKWQLSVDVEVEPGRYLSENGNVVGDQSCVVIHSCGHSTVIQAGDYVAVTIGVVGMYPVAKLRWRFSYEDIREERYTRFAGDTEIEHRNSLAAPREEAAGEHLERSNRVAVSR